MEHRVLSCLAPLGEGGLGQHLAQLVDETVEAGMRCTVFCAGVAEPAPSLHVIEGRRWEQFVRPVLQRINAAALNTLDGNVYDRRVARCLKPRSDRFMGFVGKSLYSFERARANGTGVLELVAANSHVRQVERQHELAARQLGIGDSWLGAAQVAKTIREYEAADLIYVHSDYTRDSMISRGIPENKLVRTLLKVASRFAPGPPVADEIFRIVYAGRLDATKGIPLLIRAFRQLDIPKSQLRLVGGFGSRAIREHCLRIIGGDSRIDVKSGDPVEPFQRADVYVHPSYEDGYAYAPAEALACGTPAIVTEDTGMKEYVRDGVNGFVVPTGDLGALIESIRLIQSRPLKSSSSLLVPEARMVSTAANRL